MVVKCEECRKLVIYPDPYRYTEQLESVYSCLPKSCKCGKVKLTDGLIINDGNASIWAPEEDKWLPYGISNEEIA